MSFRFSRSALLILDVIFIILLSINIPPAQAQKSFDFLNFKPYRKSVPTPTETLGYEPGVQHTNFRDQERVLFAIAQAAKDRVKVIEYGKSVEGRPLRLYVIASPEHLASLENLRVQNQSLADPRLLRSDSEGKLIAKKAPAFVWLNHCIHGDESAAFESAMWTFYAFAASDSPAIKEALQNSVVLLNPVFNPDGHERFAVWYTSVAIGSPERFAYEKKQPWAISGRFNHFRFDMNRDKMAQSQPETQQETTAFLHWMPQVFVDEHGQVENYFFPPDAQAIHAMIDPKRLEKWTDIFGKANGSAFDKNGWMYVTRETFDFFYPGYLDTWTTLSGAIGMTFETDGGGNLATRRGDETISTLNDAMAHHYTTAVTTVLTASKHREELLKDYLSYRKSAISGGKTEKLKRVVVPFTKDSKRMSELASVLLRVGIEVKELKTPLTSEKAHPYFSASTKNEAITKSFPAGSLLIEISQPQGRLARAILEPDAEFDPAFVKEQLARRERNDKKNERERKEEYMFYDITAWSLPYTFDLPAFWLEDSTNVETLPLKLDALNRVKLAASTAVEPPKQSAVAYVIPYDRENAATLALRLMAEGFRLAAVTQPAKISHVVRERGTFIARVSRNPETLFKRLSELSKELEVPVIPVDTAYSEDTEIGIGSGSIQDLKAPSIAVVQDDSVSHTGFGAVWNLLNQTGLKFTALRLSALNSSNLDHFNVVIFPDGGGYGTELGKTGIDKLKEWAREGGVLIGLGEGGSWMLDKEAAISSVTTIGSDGDDKSDDKPKEDKKEDKPKSEKAKNKKPADLAGAIFRAKLDTTHFLGYGFDREEIAVPLGGDTFWKPTTKGSNVLTFGADKQRLAGFAWPDNTEKLLANSAYVVDEPLGSGHALLFLSDPTFRAMWPGLRRLTLNGILFGPRRSGR